MKYLKILLLTFFLLASWTFAAQEDGKWGISFNIYPSHPAPGDFVQISINSYSSDLDSSGISYYINDKLYRYGMGLKKILFKIPKNDYKAIKINVVTEPMTGVGEEAETYIKPASLDLVYEVQNPYRPLFYRGKSVPLSHSRVKFFAFPNFYTDDGKKIDPKTIVYTWKVNDRVKPAASGYGKDSLEVYRIEPLGKKTIVEVEARSLDGKISATQEIVLKSKPARVHFYIDNGIMPFNFKSVAKNNNLVSDDMDNTIIAIPYFFSDIDKAKIVWHLNGIKVNLLENADPLRMTLVRNEKNILAQLGLNLKIENDDRILQSSNNNIFFKPSQNLIDQYKQKIRLQNFDQEIQESDSNFGL